MTLKEYKPGTAFPGVIGRTKVAEVSKKWFRLRDSYGVELLPIKMMSSFWP
jgi:uncharacterized protein YxjI